MAPGLSSRNRFEWTGPGGPPCRRGSTPTLPSRRRRVTRRSGPDVPDEDLRRHPVGTGTGVLGRRGRGGPTRAQATVRFWTLRLSSVARLEVEPTTTSRAVGGTVQVRRRRRCVTQPLSTRGRFLGPHLVSLSETSKLRAQNHTGPSLRRVKCHPRLSDRE